MLSGRYALTVHDIDGEASAEGFGKILRDVFEDATWVRVRGCNQNLAPRVEESSNVMQQVKERGVVGNRFPPSFLTGRRGCVLEVRNQALSMSDSAAKFLSGWERCQPCFLNEAFWQVALRNL